MVSLTPSSPLNSSVLVLNRFYMAVHVIAARRALTLLYRDTAEVVHLEDGQFCNYSFQSWCEVSELLAGAKGEHDDWIRCVDFELQIPRVIRLNVYSKTPKMTLRLTRRNLFARDEHQCQYCAKTFSPIDLSIDHVNPRCRGGETSWENVVCCCMKCNSKKGDRTPTEAGMELISKPKRPQRNPLLQLKLLNPKYEMWRSFLHGSDPVHTA